MKRKGFTLIELLAVIVILAIIALIAIPLVLKYIEKARKDAFKNTIESVERATELKVMQMKTEGNVQYPLEIDIKDLDIKNKDKLNGTVTVEKDSNNKYTYTHDVTDNNYKIYGTKESEVYKLDKTVKLKLKTDNGIIDDENNFVYSFYTEGEERLGYETINISDYFETENGLLEFEKNRFETDSTGSKIILKDNNGKVMKVYTVIIFGDINEDGWIDTGDSGDIGIYLSGNVMFNNIQLKAADVNNDGDVTDDDSQIIDFHDIWACHYNQYNNICEEY